MIYSTIQKNLIDERKASVMRQANILSGNIMLTGFLEQVTDSNRLHVENIVQKISKDLDAKILILDNKLMVHVDSAQVDVGKTMVSKEMVEALNGKDTVFYLPEKNIVNAIASVKSKDSNENIGIVYISTTSHDILKTLHYIQYQSILLMVLICFIIIIVSIYFSGIITKPLQSVLTKIKSITEGQLDQKIEIKGNGEIADIGEAFNQMTEKLRKTDTSRQEFVSNVSHELKTPLSSIKVLVESLLLQEEVDAAVYKEFLQDINSELDRENAIINDLLSLVKLDQKEMGLKLVEKSMNNFIEEILKRLKPLAEQKEIELILESRREIEAQIDEVKLSLALTNVIENGIKYTETGFVKVIVDADYKYVYITVMDTGEGIPKEDINRIFERFYRVDKTRDRASGGTGLGLSITYRTILLHKGSIKVDSELGKGSVFKIKIPIYQNS